jgi:hypothetical protein
MASPRKIDSGSYVLMDAGILLYGSTSLEAGTRPKPISEQCHELLRRCQSGEITGMITAQSLGEFWYYLWNLEFRWDSSTLESGATPPCVAQISEIRKTFTGFIDSAILVIDVTKDDFVATSPRESGDLWPSALLAAALREAPAPESVVITSTTSEFDGLPDAIVRKPNDIQRTVSDSSPNPSSDTDRAGLPYRCLFKFEEIRSSRPKGDGTQTVN